MRVLHASVKVKVLIRKVLWQAVTHELFKTKHNKRSERLNALLSCKAPLFFYIFIVCQSTIFIASFFTLLHHVREIQPPVEASQYRGNSLGQKHKPNLTSRQKMSIGISLIHWFLYKHSPSCHSRELTVSELSLEGVQKRRYRIAVQSKP